ncbi:unnamed protein product [Rotaria socialis]|uniref:MI domain-containing protein n=1 Tax=Rotaria socialis TaxID=392032 RepID=A0A820XYB3_9BILA|nr:unnamed protein product [Rotaria socialis]CAF3465916.1 unnamed protein product [Rotaria socialis]CAF4540431.1 unnamed protein product [Rotaria socialis]
MANVQKKQHTIRVHIHNEFNSGPDFESTNMFKAQEGPACNKTKSVTLSNTDECDIPPAKRRRLQGTLTKTLITEYQRLAWEALKENIKDKVKEADRSNLSAISRGLFKCNILRGRGLVANAIIRAQLISPSSTPVYAALVCKIHRKLPIISKLIFKRLILLFRRTHQRNDKIRCLAIIKFISHLINKNMLRETVALQMLLFLLENSNDHNTELAVQLLKECGEKLLHASRQELDFVCTTLTNLPDESSLNKLTQDIHEIIFAAATKEPVVERGLNLVDKNSQYAHVLQLADSCDPDDILDVFKHDAKYVINEHEYKQMRKRILDENTTDEDESCSNTSDSDEEESCSTTSDSDEDESSSNVTDNDDEDNGNEEKQELIIVDPIETDLVTLRHKICLTIQASIDAEECAHRLLKMDSYNRLNEELCQMIVDICAQQPAYECFFGLLGERICLLEDKYVYWFRWSFQHQYGQYAIAHHMENVKLSNVAKFFAHLLVTESISWNAFASIYLSNKNAISSHVYLKHLFLELFEFFGFTKLKNHLTDPTLTDYFKGLFQHNNPEDARFCINFFTSIGLGRITDELREFIISNPIPAPPARISVYNEILQNFYDRHGR